MKKIILSTFLLFYINTWSQSWLPVGGGSYQSCQFPCLNSSNVNADTDLALNNTNEPYVFYANSVFGDGDKYIKKFQNGNWITIGNTNFTAACIEPSIDISNGLPFIAYQNADYKAEARFLNGQSWQLLGTAGFSPDLANGITIRVNSQNQPYVAYADGSQLGKMTVKKYNWNTSQWETVGVEGFSTSSATFVNFEIASNDDLYVSYIDGDSNFGELPKMCVKKFDGTNWVSVGIDRFTTESIYYASFALDNNNVPYVIYTDLDETLPKLSVQKFNGTTWEYVGASRFSSTETYECDITFDVNNKPNIVYVKPIYDEFGTVTQNTLSNMKFDNGNWQFIGLHDVSLNINTINPCIEIGSNNIPYTSYEASYLDLNSNIIVGGYVSYFGTATTLVNPSLTSVSQTGIQCSNQNQYFELSGMQPNSTSSIEYNINGVVQPNITNLQAYSNGYSSIGINIPSNVSGQTLTITKVIRTDIAGTTDLICSISTTVLSNANITYYQDSDGDGLGDPTQTYQSCEGQPLNYVTNNTDCDASNPNAFINTFSNPTPSICISGSPVLVSITDNSRPVSGTTGGCLNANYGQFPSDDYTPTNYDGVSPNIIVSNGYAGEYSVVNVLANTKYIFKSERFYNDSYGANSQNDQVTIGSFDGTTILASGQHTAVWQSTVAMQIRFYSHANYDFTNQNNIGPCGTESFSRTRSIICAPTTLIQPVVWSPIFGLFSDAAGTIPYTGTAVTSVYAKPNQNTTYTLTNVNGCVQLNAITVVISGLGSNYYQDLDGDGFGNSAISQQSCIQPNGFVLNSTDCDDTNSFVFFTQLNYIDLDQDGYTNGTILLCRGLGEAPVGYTYSSNGPDCDDTNPNFHDGTIIYYADADADGFGDAFVSQTTCIQPTGYVTNNNDCDDTNPNFNSIQFVYADNDGDGFGSGSVVQVCGGFFPVPPPVGYVRNNSDCDDTDPTIGLPSQYYIDNDFDGYGSDEVIASDCSQPFGFVTNNNDCNDYDYSINIPIQYFEDYDGDSFGNINSSVLECSAPFGYVANNTDCEDTNANVNPDATEVCYDGLDNNCDGIIDEGCTPIVTVVQGAQCGSTLNSIDEYIYANIVSGAQGYRFKVTKMIGGLPSTNPSDIQTIDRVLRVFRMTQLTTYAFNTSYQVEVAVRRFNVWQPFFGSPCVVTTQATTTQVTLSQCGSTLTTMGDVIYATPVAFSTGYRFRITNLTTPTTPVILDRVLADVRMSLLSTPQYNATYSIEVAIKNTDGTYSGYGALCNITTPSFPTTSIQISQCDYVTSNAAEVLVANSFSGATMYRFRIVNATLQYSHTIDKVLRNINLTEFPGLLTNTAYIVQVSIEVGGIFGPYGKACSIIISTEGSREVSDTISNVSFDVVSYPNPFEESFILNVKTVLQEQVQVRVYDMLGKLIDDRNVEMDNISSFEIGNNYPTGVYNVIVSQGTNFKTMRVIKR